MRLALALVLSLLLYPISAFADPVFTPIAVYLGTTVATVSLVVQIGFAVAMSVYGSSQARKAANDAAEKARNDYNAGLQSRTITRVSTEAPLRTIYGTARVGSDVVGIFSSGDKDQYKHIVCVHAAHECNAIIEVYVAGKALGALDGSGNVTSGDYVSYTTNNINEVHTGLDTWPQGTPFNIANTPVAGSVTVIARGDGGEGGQDFSVPFTISGTSIVLSTMYAYITVSYRYSVGTPRVRVQKHLGTASDPADATLLAEVPSKWTSSAVLRGLCYTVIRLDLNQAEFQGGIPAIEVLVQGKKLYDPRSRNDILE